MESPRDHPKSAPIGHMLEAGSAQGNPHGKSLVERKCK